MTRVLEVDPASPDPRALSAAAKVLREGGLVAFPTETVYGLGADATSPEAVRRIYEAKGRPPDNPLIVHVASPDAVPGRLTSVGRRLAERFWPGPLSLVIARGPGIAPEVSCGLDTVAVRMPDHPVALGLIVHAGVPVAAPSANRSGRTSPTTAQHVLEDLEGRLELVLDAGPTRVGLESTVLDLTSDPPAVLRPGGVTLEQLREVVPQATLASEPTGAPRSPGTRYRHYAPRARLRLVEATGAEAAQLIRRLAEAERRAGSRVGALVTSEAARADPGVDLLEELGPAADLAVVACRLYAGLRALDARGADVIFAEAGFAPDGLGRAICDRLRRAGGKCL